MTRLKQGFAGVAAAALLLAIVCGAAHADADDEPFPAGAGGNNMSAIAVNETPGPTIVYTDPTAAPAGTPDEDPGDTSGSAAAPAATPTEAATPRPAAAAQPTPSPDHSLPIIPTNPDATPFVTPVPTAEPVPTVRPVPTAAPGSPENPEPGADVMLVYPVEAGIGTCVTLNAADVIAGYNAKLAAEGEAAFEPGAFQWFADSEELDEPISGADKSVFTTEPLTGSETYICRAYNSGKDAGLLIRFEITAAAKHTSFFFVAPMQYAPEGAVTLDALPSVDTFNRIGDAETLRPDTYAWFAYGLKDASDWSDPIPGADGSQYELTSVDEERTVVCRASDGQTGLTLYIEFTVIPGEDPSVTPVPTAAPTVAPVETSVPTAVPTAIPAETAAPGETTAPIGTAEPAATPTPPSTVPDPEILISEDGKSAEVHGDVEGLYVRIALILDSNGTSGLYVTQGEIKDGTITVPNLMIPGMTVKGVNISLVKTIEDIPSRTPAAVATASLFL